MAHVAQYKKDVVKEFVKLIKEYPIIGAVNMEGMPTPQLQNMRASLRDICVIKMSKRRLLKLAIEQAKKEKQGVEELEQYLRGMPALLFTKENPFKLFKTLQKSKSPAPAKAGQTAPNDIVVPAGPTSFAPGPVIGELGALGIKTGVENGKIAIKEDATVCKEGEKISGPLAGMLTRLGIEPMEIGLDLIAVYENGTIYKKDVLSIDEEEFLNKINNAARWAFNLSVEAAYPTKDNATLFITKSFQEAKALALEANILADMVVEEVLGKAERQMLSLKDTAGITVEVKPAEETAPAEEKKEEPEAPKEEPQPEEKPPAEEVEEKKEETKPEEKVEEAPAEDKKKDDIAEKEEEAAKDDEKTEEELKEEIKELEEEVAEQEAEEEAVKEEAEKSEEELAPDNIEKELELPEEELQPEEKTVEEPKEEPQPEEKPPAEEVEEKEETKEMDVPPQPETPKEEEKPEMDLPPEPKTPAPEESKEVVIEKPEVGEANEPTEKDIKEVIEEVEPAESEEEKKAAEKIEEDVEELDKELKKEIKEAPAEEKEAVTEKAEEIEEIKDAVPAAEKKVEELKEKAAEIKEDIKEKKIEHIKEEIEEIKEDIKEEIKNPDEKDIKKIAKEIKQVVKDVKDLKEDVPSARELAAKKKPSKADSEQVENLFDQLKKKGTLRGVSGAEAKPKKTLRTGGTLTPQEIIDQARTKMATKDKPEKVPTAHELLERKKKALKK